MQHGKRTVLKDLVLLGGGHTHVEVLKHFGLKPLPGVRLTVVCRDVRTPYSAMLPGLIAGHYGFDDVHIDLEALCRFAGAHLYADEGVGLDLVGRTVVCKSQPPVRYDVLSVNIGSAPDTSQVPGPAGAAVPVRPMQPFIAHWEAVSRRARTHTGPLRIGVIGAGAAGVEILLAMQFRLRQLMAASGANAEALQCYLFTDTANILPAHNARTRRIFERVLAERRVHVLAGQAVVEVAAGRIKRAGGGEHALDEVLWATGGSAAPWLAGCGLAVDERGFIKVADTLQSVSHPEVFAAGDIAAMVNHPRPKSGVFAVRAAKPLERNLRRAVSGRAPVGFRPQRHALSLITTGDRNAVASRNGWTLEGPLMWRWKDRIDRRFMRTFSELSAPDSRTGRA